MSDGMGNRTGAQNQPFLALGHIQGTLGGTRLQDAVIYLSNNGAALTWINRFDSVELLVSGCGGLIWWTLQNLF